MAKKKSARPAIVHGDSGLASSGLLGNRVYAAMSKTINIGNYESIRVEYGEQRVLEDGEEWQAAREDMRAVVTGTLLEMVNQVEAALKV